jgi:crotonobetaine/carnitine-CoA ligase
MFRAAVDEVPDKAWLHADEGVLTYGQAQERIERAASALRAEGIGAGDRVLVTARGTPDYLLTWFALMEVGAIQVPVSPQGTEAELEGFVVQVAPRFAVSDANVAALFDAAPDGRGPAAVDQSDVAVMIPTSGTTGRSKLVMQTHLAYVMAGEGFPYWMQLTRDDRLMTSLPLFHINAPAYSVLGSVAARASLALLPSFSATGFLDAARRFGATEFNAIGACSRSSCVNHRDPTTPTHRCDSVTRARHPNASATRRSKRASGSSWCAGTRCRRAPTG